MTMHTVVSDVLVIGGAGSAVMSAVSALRQGASVTLVSKGKVGKSGNTIMIGGSFGIDGESARSFCGEPEANQEYTRAKLFHKLVTSAFQIGDQRIERHFVDEAPRAVAELLGWVKDSGQIFKFMPKASRWRTSGRAFGNALRHGLKAHPAIRVFEDTMVTDVLTSGGTACGALGFDVYSGQMTCFKAKSVVLATGGYQPFSLQNSISDMTGDGIAMALRAGAAAVDMEFLLFIGTILEPFYAKGSLLPYLLSIPAMFSLRPKMTALDGEELPFPDDPRYRVKPADAKVNKLLMAYFYGKGMWPKWDTYGNAFYYDYSAYGDEEIRQAFRAFADSQKSWHRPGRYHRIDLQQLAGDIIANRKRLKVGFGNEYSMGGVVVAPTFATDVPGLYAAGEVTGGMFGAFRSGDGLTEMLAQGATAGKSAADFARTAPQAEADDLAAKVAWLEAPFARQEGLSPVDALAKLHAICDRGFNFYRSGALLARAYAESQELRANLDTLALATSSRHYNLEWMQSVMVRNLALCAEIGLHAALERKESRGTHLREDYPEVNNRDFLLSYTARIQGDALQYATRAPQEVFLPLDRHNYPTVADCIAQTILENA